MHHVNGQLIRQSAYKNGKAEGPWVMYHDNGQLDRKGTWKDGKKVK
jgi:antitoxin component YwqK of YwqJK toxin-antitoxin module